MNELLHKRTLTSKTFQPDLNIFNGKFHIGHIHYPSGISKNGILEDIDTTLSYSNSTKIFGMTRASYDAEIGLYGDIRFHNVDGSISISVPNPSNIEAVPYIENIFGGMGKSLIWRNLLGQDMHMYVEVRNGGIARIFRFEQKPSFNTIDMTVSISNLVFTKAPTISKDLLTSDGLILPTLSGRNVILRKPTAWNHRGEKVGVQFRFYLSGGKIHVQKIIPQTFIDSTFTESDAWLETDDVTSYYTGAGDGMVKYDVFDGSTWATVRGTSIGTATNNIGTANWSYIGRWSNWIGSGQIRWYIGRSFWPINTSGIGAGAIVTAANFKPTVNDTVKGGGSHTLIQTTQTSISSIALEDYGNLTLNSPSEGCTRINTASFTNGALYTISLNATGIGWINVTGNTLLGIRQIRDVDDSEPVSDYNDGVDLRSSEYAGTNNDPYLEVTYVPPNINALYGIGTLTGVGTIG